MARKKKRKSRLPSQRQPVQAKRYPPPDMREEIIARREDILLELIHILASKPEQEHRREIQRLAARYDPSEVSLVLEVLQKPSQRGLIGEDVFIYRHYRQAFARFGDARPFLQAQDYEDLNFEYGKLVAMRKFMALLSQQPGDRERELRYLLLPGIDFWEDIAPPAVPPRPVGFTAPQPGRYGQPEEVLLIWGWDLDDQRIKREAMNLSQWLPVIPQLIEMTLDDGLLEGWPGEKASWAPYHSLHFLGRLQAHSVAGRLLSLLDRPNDWLSDQLPTVWAQMGPPAEERLWQYLSDTDRPPNKRAIAARGLQAIAETHAGRRAEIVAGLAQWLSASSLEDATTNAYVVFVLTEMRAVEAADAIDRAFELNKVDAKIMTPFDGALLSFG